MIDKDQPDIPSKLDSDVVINSSDRKRAHIERMLARAEKRSRQAQRIVDKWKARLAELDREGIATKQARLWVEDQVQHQLTPE